MSSSPKGNGSERVVSTALLIDRMDKEGRVLDSFRVTMPGPYTMNSPTRQTAKANYPTPSEVKTVKP